MNITLDIVKFGVNTTLVKGCAKSGKNSWLYGRAVQLGVENCSFILTETKCVNFKLHGVPLICELYSFELSKIIDSLHRISIRGHKHVFIEYWNNSYTNMNDELLIINSVAKILEIDLYIGVGSNRN